MPEMNFVESFVVLRGLRVTSSNHLEPQVGDSTEALYRSNRPGTGHLSSRTNQVFEILHQLNCRFVVEIEEGWPGSVCAEALVAEDRFDRGTETVAFQQRTNHVELGLSLRVFPRRRHEVGYDTCRRRDTAAPSGCTGRRQKMIVPHHVRAISESVGESRKLALVSRAVLDSTEPRMIDDSIEDFIRD